MLQKVVVVEPLSLSKTCIQCGKTQERGLLVCPVCNVIQPFPNPPPSYFEVFGLTPQLKLDPHSLRSLFYELSQKTHPDKHSQSDTYQGLIAARWSTYINRAYQTLRESRLLSEYLLTLFSTPEEKSSAVPTELAESYFELQELLEEGASLESARSFKKNLELQQEELAKDWEKIALEWQHTEEKTPLLLRLRDQLNKEKYLLSMMSDLNKKLELS